MNRLRSIFALAAAALLLTACATRPADPAAAETPLPSPAATASVTVDGCAVAEQPGVEPPEGCVVFDAEASRELNEAYRERMPLPEPAVAIGEDHAESARVALAELGPEPTVEDVAAALASVGLDSPQVDARGVYVLFGVTFDTEGESSYAGCVYGDIGPEGVTVEVGGIIMDGGCLPAVGH